MDDKRRGGYLLTDLNLPSSTSSFCSSALSMDSADILICATPSVACLGPAISGRLHLDTRSRSYLIFSAASNRYNLSAFDGFKFYLALGCAVRCCVFCVILLARLSFSFFWSALLIRLWRRSGEPCINTSAPFRTESD